VPPSQNTNEIFFHLNGETAHCSRERERCEVKLYKKYLTSLHAVYKLNGRMKEIRAKYEYL
jgi:hypothetical protein